jgi:hypothetical protein
MATATRNANPVTRLVDPDGAATPRELMLTGVSWLLAVVGIVAATIPDARPVALWAGLLGSITAGAAQMVSSTTHSRWLIMPAWIMAGVAFLVGLLA